MQLPDALVCGTLQARFAPCPAVQAAAAGVPAPLAGDTDLQFPALLAFPADTSISICHDAAGRERALDFVRMLLLRLLTGVLPGRIQFTLIDPVGLG
ncbi:MAG: hypothetical protein ACKPJJ_06700, partial [Planctomycetaceae bacterium]